MARTLHCERPTIGQLPSGLAEHMPQNMSKVVLSWQRKSIDCFRLPDGPQGSAVLAMACNPLWLIRWPGVTLQQRDEEKLMQLSSR